MKLIVLHGDNIDKVAQRLSVFVDTAKKRGWEIKRIDPDSKLSLPEVLTAGELFEKDKLFLVGNPSKISKSEIEWLKKEGEKVKGNVVVYHEGMISKTVLSTLPKPDKVEEYTLPKLIFKFIEAFYPGNSDTALQLLHQITEPPEFVVALLARQLKDLYILSIGEKLNYPSWRASKLTAQAKKFTPESLREVISELAEADVLSKTSKQDLLSSLDLIILTKLE